MTKQLTDAHELAEARGKLYQLLAAVYAGPPSLDFLKLLAGWVASVSKDEEHSQLLSQQMRHSLSMLDSFFEKGNFGEELGETISVEFTRLFRGVKLHYSPPPPYESVYLEESGSVFGESTVAVHRKYLQFGLDLSERVSGEPPDHISFELEFMRNLCSKEADAWDGGNEEEALGMMRAEKEFLREHLLAWLPKFCNKIREYDRLGFFRELADLTEGWVAFDYQQHLQDEPLAAAAGITEG